MSTAPTPSIHIFLSQLPQHPLTTKVRFLACVVDYDPTTGQLLVEHNYRPASSLITTPTDTLALIDVTLVLESLKRDTLQPGVWINVIGYVNRLVRVSWGNQRQRQAQGNQSRDDLAIVQAVLLWDAGAVKVDEYERAIEEAQVLMKDG